MLKIMLVSALAFSLSGSPALAQSLHEGSLATAQPLRDSIRAEVSTFAAAQGAQGAGGDYMPGGMKPGYFWTSIGLMSAGGLYLLSGAVLKSSESDLCDDLDLDCGGIGTGVIVLGAGLVGTGALLWVLGKNKARAAGNPQIVTTLRGFAVRSRIGF